MVKRRKQPRTGQRRILKRTPPVDVIIDHVGARGDGVASTEFGPLYSLRQRPVFVPLSLPGERITAQLTTDTSEGVSSQLTEIIEPSADRVDPPCRHFGACGGCGLQHWASEPYQQWKRERVIAAIRRAGLEAGQIDDIVTASPGTRRRADFVMRRLQSGTVLGFHERGNNRIVDIEECLILEPVLMKVAAGLRVVATELLLPGETARAAVNLLDSGPDLLLTLPREPGRPALEALSGMAENMDLCRISMVSTADAMVVPILERRTPTIRFAGIDVRPPPGTFLQATQQGMEAIVGAVVAGVGKPTRTVELYAGCGSFSFPLHQLGPLHAIDGAAASTAAMTAAVNRASLQGTLTVETRDLADLPLEPRELEPYDVLVFDPPRAGARGQVERIAAGGPPRVVAVSCNPATFARDAHTLADAGYKIDRIVPIDQFLWSPHVELVAHFRRDASP
jgi:23S rRNA (uracil1939-C5)-methyltransferase